MTGEELKQAINFLEESQTSLATKLNISRSTIALKIKMAELDQEWKYIVIGLLYERYNQLKQQHSLEQETLNAFIKKIAGQQ